MNRNAFDRAIVLARSRSTPIKRVDGGPDWLHTDRSAADALQRLGGMASSWCTQYPLCTYYYPQLIDGEFVDLSTPEKVRGFYEKSKT